MITTPLPSSTREMGLREGQPTSSLLLQGLDESPLFKWGVLAPPTAHQGCSPEPMRGKMNALEGNPSRAGRSQSYQKRQFLRPRLRELGLTLGTGVQARGDPP